MYTNTTYLSPKPCKMPHEGSKMTEGTRMLVGVFSLKILMHLINVTDIFGYEGIA